MDIRLDVVKGIQQIKERFDFAKADSRAVPLLRKAMSIWLQKIAAQASLNAVSMFATHPSGHLAKSIMTALFPGQIGGEIFSKLPYSGVQEEGTIHGPIVPVNRQWLTQPLPAARTKAGRLKMSARKYFEKYKKVKGKSVFVGTSKRGNKLIFLSESGKLTPLFLLRKATSIEGKFFILKAIESSPGFGDYVGEDFIKMLTS